MRSGLQLALGVVAMVMLSAAVSAVSPARAQMQAPAPAQASNALEFDAAKRAADADEATLTVTQRAAIQQAQSRQLDTAVADCASPNPDTAPFVVVAELDARGKIARTWRQGDTALAKCVERELAGRFLEPPPRAPFHVSFELSFTR